MTFNGKPGFLPSKDVLRGHSGNTEREKFLVTVEILKKNEIEADGYRGCIWCSEEYIPDSAGYFYLGDGGNGWGNKNGTYASDRVALAFS